ncbi:MAG TPA: DUF1259 domain-containing protein [Gemmatimonadaceae bacterium]|nr:DUF1259 domain-containing protein [Gemmatimonadaceae bacterium]
MTGRTAALVFGAMFVCIGCSEENRNGDANAAEPGAEGAPNQASQVDWKAVEQAMKRTGSTQPGDVYRFSMPRSDLTVTVEGVRIRPALALGSWIAFKAMSEGAMAMGDLVLKESEVAPVMSRLQQAGIEQTAVHHHVLHETPRVVYMHVHAHGDPVKIAEGVRAALALTSTPPQAPSASATTAELAIDSAQITAILGHAGRVNGGVYQVSVPRAETIRDRGQEIPASMGLGTAINFQPTGNGRAAITGDFVMVASEVNAVIRALRDNGIEVTSLHNHLLTEEPRLFFMHFWANDDALKLARGLRAGLDATNSQLVVR